MPVCAIVPFRSFSGGKQRGRAKFGNIGENRDFNRIHKSLVLLELGHRLGKNHVGTDLDTGQCPINRRIHAFNRKRVGARHDDKAGIVTRINRGLDTISHFGRGYDCLVRAVAAAFLHDLVFDMNAGDTGTSHFANTSGDIEGAAPANVDVDQ